MRTQPRNSRAKARRPISKKSSLTPAFHYILISALLISVTFVSWPRVSVSGLQACPDMTGDGLVDASDLSAFAAAKATNDLSGDFTGDGTVNINDQLIIEAWLGQAVNCSTDIWGPLAQGAYCSLACPDMNRDTFVDASDLSAFAAARASQNLSADFTADGVVDNQDLAILTGLLGSTNYVCCTPPPTTQGTPVSTPAALSIAKTDGKTTALAGESTTYVVTLTNTGDLAATGVQVIDTLPGNYGALSAITDSGTATSTTITWDNMTVPGKSTKTVSYRGVIASTIAVGSPTTLLNTVVLGCTSGLPCLFTGTATDTTTVTVPPLPVPGQPVLSLEKTANTSSNAIAGQTLTYSVTVSNAVSATATAKNVKLQDILPGGFTFVSDGTGTTQFSIGDLAPGQSSTIEYQAKVGTAVAAGTYTNLVTMTADGLAAQTATADVVVRGPQVLGETVEAGDPELTAETTGAPTVRVLAETGPGVQDTSLFLLGSVFLALGGFAFRRWYLQTA